MGRLCGRRFGRIDLRHFADVDNLNVAAQVRLDVDVYAVSGDYRYCARVSFGCSHPVADLEVHVQSFGDEARREQR